MAYPSVPAREQAQRSLGRCCSMKEQTYATESATASRRKPSRGLTRRAFLSTSMALAAAAGAEFVGGKAPALAQTRTLHVLEWTSFVPAADVVRDQQAAEFGKQAGVKVTIEHINANDLPARATAAIEGRKGPDIMQLLNNSPHLYAGGLEDHNALLAELGGDKFYPFIMDAVTVDGVVRGVPYFFGVAPTRIARIFSRSWGSTRPPIPGKSFSRPARN